LSITTIIYLATDDVNNDNDDDYLKACLHCGQYCWPPGIVLRQTFSRQEQQKVWEHGRHLAFDSSPLHSQHFVTFSSSSPSSIRYTT